MDLKELRKELAKAIEDGNEVDTENLETQIAMLKACEVQKAKAAEAAKELEAQKSRMVLATSVFNAIKNNPEVVKLSKDEGVKGFTFHFSRPGVDGVMVDYKSIAIITKNQKRTASLNGGRGKTKSEYGMSLNQVFEKFASAGDVAAMELIDKATDVSGAKQWKLKNEVKAKAILDGLLATVTT